MVTQGEDLGMVKQRHGKQIQYYIHTPKLKVMEILIKTLEMQKQIFLSNQHLNASSKYGYYWDKWVPDENKISKIKMKPFHNQFWHLELFLHSRITRLSDYHRSNTKRTKCKMLLKPGEWNWWWVNTDIYTIKKYILETVLLLIKPLVSRYKSNAFSLQKI